jgi:hypothetical protein
VRLAVDQRRRKSEKPRICEDPAPYVRVEGLNLRFHRVKTIEGSILRPRTERDQGLTVTGRVGPSPLFSLNWLRKCYGQRASLGARRATETERSVHRTRSSTRPRCPFSRSVDVAWGAAQNGEMGENDFPKPKADDGSSSAARLKQQLIAHLSGHQGKPGRGGPADEATALDHPFLPRPLRPRRKQVSRSVAARPRGREQRLIFLTERAA